MIVDANVVISASLGQSRPLLQYLADRGHTLLIPFAQMREARLVTAAQAVKVGRDGADLFGWAEELLFTIPAEQYVGLEDEARGRLQRGGEKDWPLVALALASGDAIWSNDRDLFGVGVVVWNSFNIRRASAADADARFDQDGKR
ncbi:PIN domain-containing protein [Sphingomonas bacterium]|uniref:PIN domain-containing protein n=1 Tax=Sphingomonas bacterium TaxID=1895847 RepID=UPI001577372E|nr:PIN domain-containing protein [Sphingomonas bacterium]